MLEEVDFTYNTVFMSIVSMDEIHSNLKIEGGDDNNLRSLNLLEGPKYSILASLILL